MKLVLKKLITDVLDQKTEEINMKKETEYDHIKEIGGSFLDWNSETEKILTEYYHKSEIKTVRGLFKGHKLNVIVDLGCGKGAWAYFYKKIGFKKLIGIDISDERLKVAEINGFDETYCCNGYNLPFEDNSIECIISNNVLVHVLQDDDKIRIFNEINRVLKKDGLFIFNFPSAKAYGLLEDTTKEHCRIMNLSSIIKLIEKGNLKIEKISPCYFLIPRIGANPRFVNVSSKLIYPITDAFAKMFSNVNNSKVIYLKVKKEI